MLTYLLLSDYQSLPRNRRVFANARLSSDVRRGQPLLRIEETRVESR